MPHGHHGHHHHHHHGRIDVPWRYWGQRRGCAGGCSGLLALAGIFIPLTLFALLALPPLDLRASDTTMPGHAGPGILCASAREELPRRSSQKEDSESFWSISCQFATGACSQSHVVAVHDTLLQRFRVC